MKTRLQETNSSRSRPRIYDRRENARRENESAHEITSALEQSVNAVKDRGLLVKFPIIRRDNRKNVRGKIENDRTARIWRLFRTGAYRPFGVARRLGRKPFPVLCRLVSS